jgi:hypothetical protein
MERLVKEIRVDQVEDQRNGNERLVLELQESVLLVDKQVLCWKA